jgi:hypothetical protein
MARESQGLQVLLIIFVMLTVVLGVTTYLYSKRADEATKAATAANDAKRQADTATTEMQKERDLLKTFIGYPDRSTADIQKQFAEEMEMYGSTKATGDKPMFDPNTLYYSRLLAGMYRTIQDRSDEVIRSRNQVAALQESFKNREKAKDDAIQMITTSYTRLDSDVKKTASTFNDAQKATDEASKRIQDQIVKIKAGANQAAIQYTQDVADARKQAKDKESDVINLVDKLKKYQTEKMDVPSGEITWVSLPNKMVWINRGRADALQRQTKFTVFSAESSNAAKAIKKGTVEVTRIDGDHSSQARILDDKLTDPIMVGDKVFTPLWSPGQQNHFAISGIMNLDGDGHNQLSVVRGLINENGGKVDCEVDELGHKVGQITANTRYIVVGDAPDKSTPEFQKNHAEILRDADRYQLTRMSLSEFKQQMNYVKSSSVEHFGGSTTSAGNVGTAASNAKTGKAKAAPKKEDSTP